MTVLNTWPSPCVTDSVLFPLLSCRYRALGLKEAGHKWKLFFKVFCFLEPEKAPEESIEFGFLYEQVIPNVELKLKYFHLKVPVLITLLTYQCLGGSIATGTTSCLLLPLPFVLFAVCVIFLIYCILS